VESGKSKVKSEYINREEKRTQRFVEDLPGNPVWPLPDRVTQAGSRVRPTAVLQLH